MSDDLRHDSLLSESDPLSLPTYAAAVADVSPAYQEREEVPSSSPPPRFVDFEFDVDVDISVNVAMERLQLPRSARQARIPVPREQNPFSRAYIPRTALRSPAQLEDAADEPVVAPHQGQHQQHLNVAGRPQRGSNGACLVFILSLMVLGGLITAATVYLRRHEYD